MSTIREYAFAFCFILFLGVCIVGIFLMSVKILIGGVSGMGFSLVAESMRRQRQLVRKLRDQYENHLNRIQEARRDIEKTANKRDDLDSVIVDLQERFGRDAIRRKDDKKEK